MGDENDTTFTPEERELLASVRAKARAKERRRKRAAEKRRVDEKQVASKSDGLLERMAAAHGVDLATVGAVARSGCDVCDSRSTVDEVALAFVDGLCDEHATVVLRRIAEIVLRRVIPADFHGAQPGELRPELANWTPGVGGLYLYGETGVGKSHDTAALVKKGWAWWRKTHGRMPRVEWRSVPEMMDEIAATFGSKDAAPYDFESVRTCDILVLDDIGIADNMPFAVRKLYVLIEYRLQHALTTIVTSNRDLEQLAKHLNSPQIASRLSQVCAQVSYEGLPDRRPGMAPRLE